MGSLNNDTKNVKDKMRDVVSTCDMFFFQNIKTEFAVHFTYVYIYV